MVFYMGFIWDLCCFNGMKYRMTENGNDDLHGNIMFYHPVFWRTGKRMKMVHISG